MKTIRHIAQLIGLWLAITIALAACAAVIVAIDPLQGVTSQWRAT